MRRLTRPFTRYRRDLASVLEPHERARLAGAVDIACAQATLYRRRSPRLSGITSRVPQRATRQRFLALYASKKAAVVSLRARVWALLDDKTRAFCQYCGIGEPCTLDHFIEKAIIPELALYLPNLVPCCHKCNHDRRETFAVDGTRRVLHFYDDDIDGLPELLQVTFEWSTTGEPVARYDVQASSHASALISALVYVTHFATLHLARRYRIAAALELRRLRRMLGGLTAAQVTAQLHLELKSSEVYGPNDYRAALYRAILATPAVLTWMMQP